MVDLLGHYSNHHDLRKHLEQVFERLSHPTGKPTTRRKAIQVQNRLRPSDVTELVVAYRQGIGIRDLAERYDIHRHTVAEHLERHGVARPPRLTPILVAQAVELYTQGSSLARIADQLGVHPESVRYRLRQAGVKMRDAQGR